MYLNTHKNNVLISRDLFDEAWGIIPGPDLVSNTDTYLEHVDTSKNANFLNKILLLWSGFLSYKLF